MEDSERIVMPQSQYPFGVTPKDATGQALPAGDLSTLMSQLRLTAASRTPPAE